MPHAVVQLKSPRCLQRARSLDFLRCFSTRLNVNGLESETETTLWKESFLEKPTQSRLPKRVALESYENEAEKRKISSSPVESD